ncbi:MAG: hypothetical protein MJ231_00120 [bacterium]|nr:hypothetical protein [bacterium]
MFNTYIKPHFELQKPIIKDNTFIVWEPCSKNHSEVVPGYVKYLIDLGYHVSVCVEKEHIKNGLFLRFDKNEKISLNKISSKNLRKFFKKADLNNVKGVLVTTVGKLCDNSNYDQAYETFNEATDKNKIYFVEHKAKEAIDNNTWKDKIITLRQLDYKGANSVVVNPFYFGENIKITPKNDDITNFVTIGALRGNKKNSDAIVDVVKKLHDSGFENFKITVIGKGHLKNIPKEIQKYFDIKGRLSFSKMYDEIEKADFLLTSYNENNPEHVKYTKYQTSGNFQLIYGFLKPCILLESFAPINGFNDKNSILYSTDYANAMQKAINMTQDEYKTMQDELKKYVDVLYKSSLENLRGLING